MRITALLIGCLLIILVSTAAISAQPSDEKPGTLSVYQSGQQDFADGEAVQTAINERSVKPAETVIANNALVVEIEFEQLINALESYNGSTTERFLTATTGNETAIEFRIRQPAGTEGIERIAHLGIDNTTVYRTGQTAYVVVEPDAVTFELSHSSESTSVDPEGMVYALFGYEGTYISTEFRIVPQAATFEHPSAADEVVPPAVIHRPIRIFAPPEDSVRVRATFEDGKSIMVRPNWTPRFRTVDLSLNLSEVAPGTEYTLELLHNGEIVDRRTGTVVKPEATLHEIQLIDDRTMMIRVTLSHGGTLTVRDDGGQVIAEQNVSSGNETELLIPLPDDLRPPIHVSSAGNSQSDIQMYPKESAKEIIVENLRITTDMKTSDELRQDITSTPSTPDSAVTPTDTERTTAGSSQTPTDSNQRAGLTVVTGVIGLIVFATALVRQHS
jgi:hypothetical protein